MERLRKERMESPKLGRGVLGGSIGQASNFGFASGCDLMVVRSRQAPRSAQSLLNIPPSCSYSRALSRINTSNKYINLEEKSPKIKQNGSMGVYRVTKSA